jgi:hypothetical protein
MSPPRFADCRRDANFEDGMPHQCRCSYDEHDGLIAFFLRDDQDDDANAHEDSKCGLPPIPPLRLPHGEPLGTDDQESDKVQGQRDAKPPQGNVFAFIKNVGARVPSHEHFVNPR